MMLSPDSKQVAISGGNRLFVFDVDTGKRIFGPLRSEADWGSSPFLFSPDSRSVAVVTKNNEVQVWDLTTVRPAALPLRYRTRVDHVAISPDGRLIATASDLAPDLDLRIREILPGVPTLEQLHHPLWLGPSRRYASDGGIAVKIVQPDEIASIIDTKANLELTSFKCPFAVRLCAISEKSHTVLFGGDGVLELIDFDEKNWSHPRTLLASGNVQDAAFTPDGKTAVSCNGKTARLWDVATAQPLGNELDCPFDVQAIEFDKSGTAIRLYGPQAKSMKRNLAAPLPDVSESLRIWNEARTGRTIDELGRVGSLTPEDWQKQPRRTDETRAPLDTMAP